MRRTLDIAGLLVLVSLMTSARAACQPTQIFNEFDPLARGGQTAQFPPQFDFAEPGARSLALGSAFVAVADDATAAFTNPAGLTFLLKPEVSAEVRFRRLDTSFLSGGRLSGIVTNRGQDTVAGAVYANSLESETRPYFLSFVYPGRQWAIAAYRHELVRQRNEFATNGSFRQGLFAGVPINNERQAGLAGSRNITGDAYGASFAYRFGNFVSAGVGVSILHVTLDSTFTSYFHTQDFFGPNDRNALSGIAIQRGESTKAAVNAGVLVNATPNIRFGAVFRQGASFGFSDNSTFYFLGTPSFSNSDSGLFRTPHVFGAGVRAQVTNALSVSADVDHVTYSRLTQDFIALQVFKSDLGRISVSDVNEVHGGAEIVLTRMSHTPAVRFGAWYDPRHSVEYASDNSGSPDDLLLKAFFPGGENLMHYCFGFGLPVSPQFEFNAGADLSKQRQYVSASLVARFGR